MKQNILNKIKEEKREREIGRFSSVRIIERFPTLCAHSRNDFRRTSAIFVKRKVRSIERDAFPIQKYVPSVVKTTIRARMRIFISPLFYKKCTKTEKEFPWFLIQFVLEGENPTEASIARLRLRVRKLSIYQYTRINVPAPFSTNHRWNRQRLETECSGPTSGRTTPEPPRLPRARFGTIDFFSQKRRQICCCS